MDDQVNRTVFASGLDDRVTEEHLFELFLQAGPLVNVSMKKTNTVRYKFAFIIFKHSESVPYAIELFKNVQLFGRTLFLKPRDGSEHNDSTADTTDSTPIDLQHKVLDFITSNSDVLNALPEIKSMTTLVESRKTASDSLNEKDDSYDPLSNFTIKNTYSVFENSSNNLSPYQVRPVHNQYANHSQMGYSQRFPIVPIPPPHIPVFDRLDRGRNPYDLSFNVKPEINNFNNSPRFDGRFDRKRHIEYERSYDYSRRSMEDSPRYHPQTNKSRRRDDHYQSPNYNSRY